MKWPGKGAYGVVLVSLLLTLSASCAIVPKKVRGYAVGFREAGMASWYGPGFHGRKTSSGEVFDMHGFTAAHRTMPFGTYLKVTDRENGRWVRVKVNDRGPFIRGRILDLSYGAAKALDMIGTGTAAVEIHVVGREEDLARVVRNKGTERYTVQVGAFVRKENALNLKQSLERRYQPVYIVIFDTPDRNYYRVRVGNLSTEKLADQLASRLNTQEKLETFVLRED